MKGISSIIATLLMLIVTIGLAALAYGYIMGIWGSRITQTFQVVEVYNDTVTIMNSGSNAITELKGTISSSPVDAELQVTPIDSSLVAYWHFDEGDVWWDSSWPYRKSITIDNTKNSNTLTDYQVLITIDTASLISAGKMRSDCGDIRFTDSDGTTQLSYWLESGCNSANTKIWVKVLSIPASSTKTIYMYYGNPSATSVSDVRSTFISNSIYAMEGDCKDSTYCGYMDNHIEANVIRGYPANIGTKYVDKIYWGSVYDGSPPSGVREYFYSRFRFLFLPNETGTWYFAVDSDDGSELILNPGDKDVPNGEERVVARWYGGHGWCNCQSYYGTISLTANQAVWMDYLQEEWTGGEAAVVWAQKPGGSWVNLNATNFPNMIFARKYTSPEPTTSIGEEAKADNIAHDSSGYNNDGTIYGASRIDGNFGRALRFDGKNDYVDIPDNANGNYPRTFAAWIKGVPLSGRYDIVNARRSYFNIQDGKVCFYISGANSQYLCSQKTIDSSGWNFVAASYENGVEKVYVNGEFSGSLSVGVPDTGTSQDVIGVCSYCGWSSWFNGIIDEVRIYNRALSEEEIKAHASSNVGVAIMPGQTAKVKVLNVPSKGGHTLKLCTPNQCQTIYLTII